MASSSKYYFLVEYQDEDQDLGIVDSGCIREMYNIDQLKPKDVCAVKNPRFKKGSKCDGEPEFFQVLVRGVSADKPLLVSQLDTMIKTGKRHFLTEDHPQAALGKRQRGHIPKEPVIIESSSGDDSQVSDLGDVMKSPPKKKAPKKLKPKASADDVSKRILKLQEEIGQQPGGGQLGYTGEPSKPKGACLECQQYKQKCQNLESELQSLKVDINRLKSKREKYKNLVDTHDILKQAGEILTGLKSRIMEDSANSSSVPSNRAKSSNRTSTPLLSDFESLNIKSPSPLCVDQDPTEGDEILCEDEFEDFKSSYVDRFDDTKEQLMFSKEDDEVMELRKDSGVYIKIKKYNSITSNLMFKTASSVACALMEGIFKVEALKKCSMFGANCGAGEQRPALHIPAVKAMVEVSRLVEKKYKWKTIDDKAINKAVGSRLCHIRNEGKLRSTAVKAQLASEKV